MAASILNDLLKAAGPSPVTCLGIPLRPFSLGALLLLQRFNNAFLLRSEIRVEQHPPQDLDDVLPVGDLLQAIICCAFPFQEAQDALRAPDLQRDVHDWFHKLAVAADVRRLKLPFLNSRRSKAKLQARIDRAKHIFMEYLRAGLAYPCTKAETGPWRPIGTPWPMLTLTGLMEELHQDFHTAVNQPLALSRWLVAANGERKGLLEVCDRNEVADLKAEADKIAAEIFGESRIGVPPLSSVDPTAPSDRPDLNPS